MTPNVKVPGTSQQITWTDLEDMLKVATSEEASCSGKIVVKKGHAKAKRFPFSDLHHHDLGVMIAIKAPTEDHQWSVVVQEIH